MTGAEAAAAAAVAASAAAVAATSAAGAVIPPPRTTRSGPTGSDTARPFAPTRPPPSESLAKAYFTPIVTPTPVSTRLPKPSSTADTINGFLRVEAGGGTLRAEGVLWDVSVILHAYSNNSQETVAEELIGEALTWGAAAQGYTQQMGNGDLWYITYSRVSALAVRRADPLVNMTRYRAMLTWRVPGLPLIPGQRARRINSRK